MCVIILYFCTRGKLLFYGRQYFPVNPVEFFSSSFACYIYIFKVIIKKKLYTYYALEYRKLYPCICIHFFFVLILNYFQFFFFSSIFIIFLLLRSNVIKKKLRSLLLLCVFPFFHILSTIIMNGWKMEKYISV